MKNATKLRIEKYKKALMKKYGVQDVESFEVSPAAFQGLYAFQQESNEFLTQINMHSVTDLAGELVGVNMAGAIIKRTDTPTNERVAVDPFSMDSGLTYNLKKTEFDIAYTYARLDAWARRVAFQAELSAAAAHRIGLDRIMVGWNGTSAAADTDSGSNPLGEDVNIGWIQYLINKLPANFMLEGANAGEIRVGEGAGSDYTNFDALVYDLVAGIPQHKRAGLVVVVGDGIANAEGLKFYNGLLVNTPSEKDHIKTALKNLGGQTTVSVPFFPDWGLMVTSLDNLSIYTQETSVRRKFIDNPKLDQYEDMLSMNEGYAIEDPEKATAIEDANIRVWNGSAWVAPA